VVATVALAKGSRIMGLPAVPILFMEVDASVSVSPRMQLLADRHWSLDGKVAGNSCLPSPWPLPQMATTRAALGATFTSCADASSKVGGVFSASIQSYKGLLDLAQKYTQLLVDGLRAHLRGSKEEASSKAADCIRGGA
jgi:hypothetical protein